MKYVSNLGAFVNPMINTFAFVPEQVEAGVYGAFGATPPKRPQHFAPGQASVALQSYDRIGLATIPTLPAPPPAESLSNRLSSSRRQLQVHQVTDAAERTFGDAADSLFSLRQDFARGVARFPGVTASYQTGGSSASEHLSAFLNGAQTAHWDMIAAEGALGADLSELFYKVLSAEYGSPSDPAYLADRKEAVGQIDRALRALQALDRNLKSVHAALTLIQQDGGTQALPVLVVEAIALTSSVTGEGVVTAIPENFRLRARILKADSDGDGVPDGLEVWTNGRVIGTTGFDQPVTVALPLGELPVPRFYRLVRQ